MALPKKTTGSGTKAFFSADKTDWKEFASISKISPPSMSRGTVEVTDMNSYENNNQFKEFLGDFIEAEEMSIEGYFVKDDEGREALEAAFYAGTNCYIKIQLPPAIGQDMIVGGVLTKYQAIGEISTSAGIPFTLSMKPNGKPEMSPTAEQASVTPQTGENSQTA